VLDALKADKKRAPELDAIWSSPLVRARQTAEIAAEVLGVKMTICEALACGASVALLRQHFKQLSVPERLMLVGHEPDCGMILSELVGAADPQPFKKAGVAHLRGEFKPRGMELEYQLSPKDLLGGD
jgi:phosphohistidine phosphatase